ncbi:IS30 family transposase [Mycoplasmopsis adleri]|uniref:IS30 family transposase n=1 Tax=Mycoplasmopsis adleri TaxID=51362 RepID=UPI003872AE98
MKNNKKFNYNLRVKLEFLLWTTNNSISKIANKLGFNRVSIIREIKNNSTFYGYFAEDAEIKNRIRCNWNHHFRMINNMEKYKEFSKKFKQIYDGKIWTVELTYERIKNNFPALKVPSLKTVYNWINTNQWVIKRKHLLRKYYKKDGKRGKESAVRRLVGSRWIRPIWTRPRSINERSEFGRWEIDLIVGKRSTNSPHIMTFTERVSRIGFLVKLQNKNPWKLASALWDLIKRKHLNVKSITQDNGFEFSSLFAIASKLKIYIYKADPYTSFQRGSDENFNGMVRRFFKKHSDFSTITNERLMEVQDKMNSRPRKFLNYLSTIDVYAKLNQEDPWKEIPIDEPLYSWQRKKIPSNTRRNEFFHLFKKKKF